MYLCSGRENFHWTFFIFATLFISFTQTPASAAKITWEVEQPFRFLRYASDHLIHKLAWEDAKVERSGGVRPDLISAMERRLSSPSWWRSSGAFKRYSVERRNDVGRGALAYKRSDIARNGWASLVKANPKNGRKNAISAATCWNVEDQTYRGCRSDIGYINGRDQYVRPRQHRITLSITNPPPGRCDWVIEGYLGERNQGYFGLLDDDSAEARLKGVNCAAKISAKVAWKRQYTLRVTRSEDGKRVGSTRVLVKDHLVVSIGDSFASGEGNPDIPARLDTKGLSPYHTERGVRKTSLQIPRRLLKNGHPTPVGAAVWHDTRCHRSLYSSHTRAAIALALAPPRHHAITYLSFACSGAEIAEGLFWPQDGVECAETKRTRRFMEPQFSAAVDAIAGPRRGGVDQFGNTAPLRNKDHFYKDFKVPRKGRLGDDRKRSVKQSRGLCKAWPAEQNIARIPQLRRASIADRPIDALLISVGGNDMGFAAVVAKTVFDPKIGERDGFLKELATRVLRRLTTIDEKTIDNYRQDLEQRLRLLRRGIDSKLEMGSRKDRVFHVLYPDPTNDQKGDICNTGRRGMNVSGLAGLNGRNNDFSVKDAKNFINKLNRKLEHDQSDAGYTIVDSHLVKFRKHGVCAFKADESSTLPTKSVGPWGIGKSMFRMDGDFRPYQATQRWFRTLNDTYTLIHAFKSNAEKPPRGNGLRRQVYQVSRAASGAFHPNAQGHAVIADAIYCAVASKLFKGVASAQCKVE